MFQFIFEVVEIFGVIGIIRVANWIHKYFAVHPVGQTSGAQETQTKAWTYSLGYVVVAMVLFWLAHMSSNSISVLIFGVSSFSGIVAFFLFAMLAFVVAHLLVGGFFLVPYLARLLARASTNSNSDANTKK